MRHLQMAELQISQGSGVYRYRCGVQGGFSKPPLYCREYERRGEGGGEDGGSTALGAGPGAAEDGGTEQEKGAGTAAWAESKEKYNNVRTDRTSETGSRVNFDSKKEARRYDELMAMLRAGRSGT